MTPVASPPGQAMVMSQTLHSEESINIITDHSTFAPEILVSAIVLMICSSVAVAMRVLRSWQGLHKFDWHDGFLVSAQVCGLIMSISCAALTSEGLGTHDYSGDLEMSKNFQSVLQSDSTK